MRLEIQNRGLKNLERKLSQRANLLGRAGLRDVLQQAGRDLVQSYQKNIQSFSPGAVPDLTAKYKKRKQAKHGRVYPILFATGTLSRSLAMRVLQPTKGRPWTLQLIFKGGRPEGKITNARLAEIHIRGEGNNPKRDFTRLPAAWSRKIFNDIRAAIRRGR